MKRLTSFLILTSLIIGLLSFSGVTTQAETYRFVIVPKVVHPWFDKVVNGAREMARILEEQTGDEFRIDYRAPSSADVQQQNKILEQAAATRPDGITVDVLDPSGNLPILQSINQRGIPLVFFDTEPPPEMKGFTSVGNDFCEQAKIASRQLVELMKGEDGVLQPEEGQVAIMQGFPTATNHRIRFECHKEYLNTVENVEIVATGIDNDDIQRAQNQASSIISAHPDLDGFLSCNAAGPIGIGLAIKEAGKVGEIKSVGMDDLDQLLQLIKEGVVHSSSSTKPRMQGREIVRQLWMQNLGVSTPDTIDTGIAIITKDDIPEDLDEYASP